MQALTELGGLYCCFIFFSFSVIILLLLRLFSEEED